MLELVGRSKLVENASPKMLADSAMWLSTLGASDVARDLARVAASREPKNPVLRYLHASLLMFAGRNEEARVELDCAIALRPDYPQAIWLRSRLRPASASDNSVDAMRSLLRAEATPEARTYLGYALHNELHDLGDFDHAWSALMEALREKRGRVQYDAALQSKLVDEIIASPCRRVELQTDVDGTYRPLFIVGMYRSGTTLLERILAGHSAVADGGETYIFTTQLRFETDYACKGVLDARMVELLKSDAVDFRRVGQNYLKASDWRRGGKSALTEKLPSNVLNAGYIAQSLPSARLMHMRRDPVDTCFSNLRTLFTDAAPYSYDLVELADYYADYVRLANHWRATLKGQWLDVDYADLVNDPRKQAERVFAHCELQFEQEALEIGRAGGSVSTASAVDVRKGILRDRGRAWAPYAAHLQPLLDRLGARGLI